jgi:hypothetical protein
MAGRLTSNFLDPAGALDGLVVTPLLAAFAFIHVDVVRHLLSRGLLGKLV